MIQQLWGGNEGRSNYCNRIGWPSCETEVWESRGYAMEVDSRTYLTMSSSLQLCTHSLVTWRKLLRCLTRLCRENIMIGIYKSALSSYPQYLHSPSLHCSCILTLVETHLICLSKHAWSRSTSLTSTLIQLQVFLRLRLIYALIGPYSTNFLVLSFWCDSGAAAALLASVHCCGQCSFSLSTISHRAGTHLWQHNFFCTLRRLFDSIKLVLVLASLRFPYATLRHLQLHCLRWRASFRAVESFSIRLLKL